MNYIAYRERHHWKYVLDEEYSAQTPISTGACLETGFMRLLEDGELEVYAGYAWDGPSGPTVDTPTVMRGSLEHDVFYDLMRRGVLALSWREAVDARLRAVIEEDVTTVARTRMGRKLGKLRARYFYWAVRRFAKKYADPAKVLHYAPCVPEGIRTLRG